MAMTTGSPLALLLKAVPITSGRGKFFGKKPKKGWCIMKYGELKLGQIEAVVNKHGGMDGLQRFLSGETVVVDATPDNQFRALMEEYLPTMRCIVLDATKMLVNLDADPNLPFTGADVVSHTGGGWVLVERREEDLYVDGKKILFFLSGRQLNGKTVKGLELREEVTSQPVFNANLLDALADNPQFIPEGWKKDADGKPRYIFFWGTIYRHAYARLCVRYLYWRGGRWNRSYDWLGSDAWDSDGPAAVSASSEALAA
jgi:hypothetical protein